MPSREIAGLQTHWMRFGSGPRAALLLHCSLAQSGAWAPFARFLSDDLTMTAMDLPGHGRSGPWEDETREVQEVSAAMALGVLPDGAVDLIGHSFGATVALRLAVEHPDRVRSLTLIEPVFFKAGVEGDADAKARLMEDFAPFDKAWSAGDRAEAARVFLGLWGGGPPWEALSAAQRDRLSAQIHLVPAANPALFDDVGQILPRLSALDLPVLLLEGSESHWVIPRISEGLQARLPQARRVVIDGAGHMAPLTHPEAVAQAVREHLAPVTA